MRFFLRNTLGGATFLCLAATVPAADSSAALQADRLMKTVGGYISAGGVLSDLETFNSRVTGYGYPRLKDYAYHLGAGTFTVRKRLITGLELQGTAWRPTETASTVTELYGLSGIVNIGFNVLPEGRFRLYPYVGAGFGRLLLRLRQKSATFDDAVAEPLDDLVLSQRVGALQAGLGADFTIPRRRHPGRSRVIGLRAGYVFDPTPARDWESVDIRIGGGPSLAANGVYAQLVLGTSAERPRRLPGKCAMKYGKKPRGETHEAP